MTKTTQGASPLMGILLSLSICHCCNDALQALVSSLYPMIKSDLGISFAQIGLLSLCYQLTASIFQPLSGIYLDRKPNPYFITLSACLTFMGLMCLAFADSFVMIILSVMIVGMGSAIVHPEASRLTAMASGGRRGLAQSVFQVGGNLGSSIGPLLAAFLVAPYGRHNIALVAVLSFVGVGFSLYVSRWYKQLLKERKQHLDTNEGAVHPAFVHEAQPFSKRRTRFYIAVLIVLIFSKFVYTASISSYYTFYTMEKFGLSLQHAQYALFVFVFATALGTLVGGPLGDKIGRKNVIWFSILGTSPFALAMPYMGMQGSLVCSFFSGLIISSAFPAIVIFAQELLPSRLGMVSGLFFGFAFGIAGLAAACWGVYAQYFGVEAVFALSSYLPLLGCVAILLPKKLA
ncbi:MAG: MFS transporter [Akkermansia sp.]